MFVCILRKLDSIEKALTSSGEKASGAETSLLSIIEAMLVHGMIVKGRSERMHYGTAAVGFPKRNELNLCRKLGRDVAGLVTMLLAGIVFTPFS